MQRGQPRRTAAVAAVVGWESDQRRPWQGCSRKPVPMCEQRSFFQSIELEGDGRPAPALCCRPLGLRTGPLISSSGVSPHNPQGQLLQWLEQVPGVSAPSLGVHHGDANASAPPAASAQVEQAAQPNTTHRTSSF